MFSFLDRFLLNSRILDASDNLNIVCAIDPEWTFKERFRRGISKGFQDKVLEGQRSEKNGYYDLESDELKEILSEIPYLKFFVLLVLSSFLISFIWIAIKSLIDSRFSNFSNLLITNLSDYQGFLNYFISIGSTILGIFLFLVLAIVTVYFRAKRLDYLLNKLEVNKEIKISYYALTGDLRAVYSKANENVKKKFKKELDLLSYSYLTTFTPNVGDSPLEKLFQLKVAELQKAILEETEQSNQKMLEANFSKISKMGSEDRKTIDYDSSLVSTMTIETLKEIYNLNDLSNTEDEK